MDDLDPRLGRREGDIRLNPVQTANSAAASGIAVQTRYFLAHGVGGWFAVTNPSEATDDDTLAAIAALIPEDEPEQPAE